jgi:hypothetical protein
MAASSSSSGPSPSLRASDADRERVAGALRRHHLDGRLDTDELQERLGACYAARTLDALEPLLADLPGERRPAPRPRRGAPPRPWAWPAPPMAAVMVVALTVATLGAIAHGRPDPVPFIAVFLLLRLAWWGPRRRTAWGPRG